eukprot:750132_1
MSYIWIAKQIEQDRWEMIAFDDESFITIHVFLIYSLTAVTCCSSSHDVYFLDLICVHRFSCIFIASHVCLSVLIYICCLPYIFAVCHIYLTSVIFFFTQMHHHRCRYLLIQRQCIIAFIIDNICIHH